MPYRVHGQLNLSFTCADDRTVMRVHKQRPPLQVIRAFALENGGSLVHLHTVSGGILGGDRLDYEIEVNAGAQAQLTTTSATRLYRSRENAPPASQSMTVRLRQDSLLEYLPDALIPFAGSRYQQHTRFTLDQGAGLFWWEVVAPGREARAEVFAYDSLHLNTDIIAADLLIARERMKLEPRSRPLSSYARFGTHRYMATLYICRVGLDSEKWIELEAQLQDQALQLTRPHDLLWGVSTLPAHGLVIRGVSRGGRDLFAGLISFWRAAKWALYQQAAVMPRKIY